MTKTHSPVLCDCGHTDLRHAMTARFRFCTASCPCSNFTGTLSEGDEPRGTDSHGQTWRSLKTSQGSASPSESAPTSESLRTGALAHD
jgi:hypothetical protein